MDTGNIAKTEAYMLLSSHIARLLARLGFLGSAALIVGSLVMGQNVQWHLVAACLVLLALTTLAGGLADRLQAGMEAEAAVRLRRDAVLRLSALGARQVQAIPAGQLVTSIQRHPEALAALALGYRVARMMMGIGPLISAGALMAVSWQAAVAVLCLTPVMIVFFALVGGRIRKRADAQEQALGHLAGQFADRLRTLPTILANDALDREEAKLADRLRIYAERTMGVLRIAFLNAGIIDFFASLSIAMLAVFLGLGHLGLANIPGFSGLTLSQSLFILMIAPEYYAPFRRFAEMYHAKAEGEAAARALDALLTPKEMAAPPSDLSLLADLPQTGLVALVGPSGSGKTTLLRRFANVDETGIGGDTNHAWVSTDSYVHGGTLADAIGWNNNRAGLEEAAAAASLLDEHYLPGGLEAHIAPGGANLSGGQRLRLGVARALVSGRTILADEPTAKLDRTNAARIRAALAHAAKNRLVLVATHDPELAALAARVIELEPVKP